MLASRRPFPFEPKWYYTTMMHCGFLGRVKGPMLTSTNCRFGRRPNVTQGVPVCAHFWLHKFLPCAICKVSSLVLHLPIHAAASVHGECFTICWRCWCRFYKDQQSIVNFARWTMNQSALWQLKFPETRKTKTAKPLASKMAAIKKNWGKTRLGLQVEYRLPIVI